MTWGGVKKVEDSKAKIQSSKSYYLPNNYSKIIIIWTDLCEVAFDKV